MKLTKVEKEKQKQKATYRYLHGKETRGDECYVQVNIHHWLRAKLQNI